MPDSVFTLGYRYTTVLRTILAMENVPFAIVHRALLRTKPAVELWGRLSLAGEEALNGALTALGSAPSEIDSATRTELFKSAASASGMHAIDRGRFGICMHAHNYLGILITALGRAPKEVTQLISLEQAADVAERAGNSLAEALADYNIETQAALESLKNEFNADVAHYESIKPSLGSKDGSCVLSQLPLWRGNEVVVGFLKAELDRLSALRASARRYAAHGNPMRYVPKQRIGNVIWHGGLLSNIRKAEMGFQEHAIFTKHAERLNLSFGPIRPGLFNLYKSAQAYTQLCLARAFDKNDGTASIKRLLGVMESERNNSALPTAETVARTLGADLNRLNLTVARMSKMPSRKWRGQTCGTLRKLQESESISANLEKLIIIRDKTLAHSDEKSSTRAFEGYNAEGLLDFASLCLDTAVVMFSSQQVRFAIEGAPPFLRLEAVELAQDLDSVLSKLLGNDQPVNPTDLFGLQM